MKNDDILAKIYAYTWGSSENKNSAFNVYKMIEIGH